MGRCGILGRQTIFHQPDMHAADFDSFWLGGIIAGRCQWSVAKSHVMHPVDGNLMLGHKVALNCLGKPLRILDPTDPAPGERASISMM